MTSRAYRQRKIEPAMNRLLLLGAVIALVLWFTITFIAPVGLGLEHLLLALGVILWIAWWALKDREARG
jgi:hypothetical protein